MWYDKCRHGGGFTNVLYYIRRPSSNIKFNSRPSQNHPGLNLYLPKSKKFPPILATKVLFLWVAFGLSWQLILVVRSQNFYCHQDGGDSANFKSPAHWLYTILYSTQELCWTIALLHSTTIIGYKRNHKILSELVCKFFTVVQLQVILLYSANFNSKCISFSTKLL